GKICSLDLSRHAELECPNMAILFISGYQQDVEKEKSGVITRHPVLTKPFSKRDLVCAVEQAVSEPANA
ncbi:MAG: hypothetical protein AAFO72_09815, partial [Pseudomonadota bacterium]